MMQLAFSSRWRASSSYEDLESIVTVPVTASSKHDLTCKTVVGKTAEAPVQQSKNTFVLDAKFNANQGANVKTNPTKPSLIKAASSVAASLYLATSLSLAP
ncbi:MAG: hypothetical protein Q7T66_01295 [Herminiimonas sp.]|uniref:hypothetical protein n=1 Tax=Herminiimonas sp. TaxID=1926289 RepID=UPI00271B24DB|nr:hypothetical protein [Herminiimonas sp.]MDO9419274.1 hypothetical protein [Herminiimonas sp.]